MQQSRYKEYLIAAILALFSGIAISLRMTVFTIKQLETDAGIEGMHRWFRLIWDFKMSLSGYSVAALLFTCLLGIVFFKALQITEARIRKTAVLPALLFAFFQVFGQSFQETAGWHEVFANARNLTKAGVKYIGLFLLFYALCTLFLAYMKRFSFCTASGSKPARSWFTCNRRSLFVVFGLILLMWLPYAIAYFPGLTNYDFFDELNTFYGIDTNSLRAVVPISDAVTLNNNNPVLQTLLAVGVMKLGTLLGSPYIGIFLFCYGQMLVFALILSYSLYYLAQLRVRAGIRAAILLIYGLVPWHANFALTTLKDTNFAFVMLLYLILLSDCVLRPEAFFQKKSKLLLFAGANLVLMLLRNNGIYLLLIVDVVLLIAFRKYWKKIWMPTVVPALLYLVVITNLLYPALKITPGSKAEMYSVFFQQTARLVKTHPDAIDPADREIIKKVLPKYDELAERYDPELADPVKSTYNKYTTPEEMSAYLKVWAKYLVKYPSLYIQAAACDCYGYFYPQAEHWLVYSKIEPPGLAYGVESPQSLSVWRQEMVQAVYVVKQIPGLGLFVSVGFYTWLMILALVYLIYRGEKRKLLLWTPCLVLLLTVLAGPANTMPRYVYPLILALPMLWALSGCPVESDAKPETAEQA